MQRHCHSTLVLNLRFRVRYCPWTLEEAPDEAADDALCSGVLGPAVQQHCAERQQPPCWLLETQSAMLLRQGTGVLMPPRRAEAHDDVQQQTQALLRWRLAHSASHEDGLQLVQPQSKRSQPAQRRPAVGERGPCPEQLAGGLPAGRLATSWHRQLRAMKSAGTTATFWPLWLIGEHSTQAAASR